MKATFIRPIALCLFHNNGRILVSEAYDSVKQNYYCRPIGGGIEPGERSAHCIVREVCEELNARIENLTLVGVIENVFTCEGEGGHEIVFVYDATFTDRSLYDSQTVCGDEQGMRFEAHWKSLEEIENSPVRLVPEGLLELIREKLL